MDCICLKQAAGKIQNIRRNTMGEYIKNQYYT